MCCSSQRWLKRNLAGRVRLKHDPQLALILLPISQLLLNSFFGVPSPKLRQTPFESSHAFPIYRASENRQNMLEEQITRDLRVIQCVKEPKMSRFEPLSHYVRGK